MGPTDHAGLHHSLESKRQTRWMLLLCLYLGGSKEKTKNRQLRWRPRIGIPSSLYLPRFSSGNFVLFFLGPLILALVLSDSQLLAVMMAAGILGWRSSKERETPPSSGWQHAGVGWDRLVCEFTSIIVYLWRPLHQRDTQQDTNTANGNVVGFLMQQQQQLLHIRTVVCGDSQPASLVVGRRKKERPSSAAGGDLLWWREDGRRTAKKSH